MRNQYGRVFLFLSAMVCMPKTSHAAVLDFFQVSIEKFGGFPESPDVEGNWCDLRDRIFLDGPKISRTVFCGPFSSPSLAGKVKMSAAATLNVSDIDLILNIYQEIITKTPSGLLIDDFSCEPNEDVNHFAMTVKTFGKEIKFEGPNSHKCLPDPVFSILHMLNSKTSPLLGIRSPE